MSGPEGPGDCHVTRCEGTWPGWPKWPRTPAANKDRHQNRNPAIYGPVHRQPGMIPTRSSPTYVPTAAELLLDHMPQVSQSRISEPTIRTGRTRTPKLDGTFYGQHRRQTISNQHENRTLQQIWNPSSADQNLLPTRTHSSPTSIRHILATLRSRRSLHPFPTHVLRCSTSTLYRSGNTPSHTSHLVFPHGPRPVSHVTPPGIRHSRPARSRGRPLRTLPGHHTPLSAVHPPRCSCLTNGCPGAPSARGHVTLTLVPHNSTALAPHDFTALAPHDPRPPRLNLRPGHSTFDLNAAHRPVIPIVDVP